MENNEVTRVYKSPITWLAQIFAVMVSWYYNHSIAWAILHFLLGWIYLLYSLLIGRFAHGGFMQIIHYYF